MPWLLLSSSSPTFSNLLHVCVSQKGDWATEKVISVPSKKVEGWLLPEMPSEYKGPQWVELYLHFRTFKKLLLK